MIGIGFFIFQKNTNFNNSKNSELINGINNSSIESKDVLLPLYKMKCDFISPARYEDEILILTKI